MNWLFNLGKNLGFTVIKIEHDSLFTYEVPNTLGSKLTVIGSLISVFVLYLISATISYYHQRRKNI